MAYLETLLPYKHDDMQIHFTRSFWYTDEGDFLSYNQPVDTKRGYHDRWKLRNKSAVIKRMVAHIAT